MFTHPTLMKTTTAATMTATPAHSTAGNNTKVKTMSRSYFTEDQKLVRCNFPKWTWEEQDVIRETLWDKGYFCNTVSRIGADGKSHDAIQVKRRDIPQLVEEFFRQRIVAEYQAEGSYDASIIFSHNYAAESIIDAINRFRKNKLNGGVL